jgi:hypothetical protein
LPRVAFKVVVLPLFRIPTRLLGISLSLIFCLFHTSFAAEARFLENGNPVPKGGEVGFLSDTPLRTKVDLSGLWNYSVEGSASGMVKVPSAYDFVGKVTLERKFDISAEQIDKYTFNLVILPRSP